MTRKRVLLCVTGMTPQVVTETLFALKEKSELPDEIIVITTARGKNRAVRDLLDAKEGRFWEFCNAFNLPGISFDESSIEVITNNKGDLLEDIRSPQDNSDAADFIMNRVRELCQNDDIILHVSLAGGRKSMGFLVGYALSIFGREEDKLSHVLVSEEFEGNRDFFFPSPNKRRIISPTGKELDTSNAFVGLAEIPFIRLRTGLTSDVLQNRLSFGETVSLAQKEVAPDRKLVFVKSELAVYCSNQKIILPPVHFALYYWFAQRAAEGLGPIRPGQKSDVMQFLSCLKLIKEEDDGDYGRVHKTLRNQEYLLSFVQEHRTRLNKKIKEALGVRADPYLISSTRKKPGCSYFLELTADQIEFS